MSTPAPKHFNTTAGAIPYRDLFKKVSISPADCSLAFISTQWAADPKTGELVDGVADDYGKQAEIVWTNVCDMLRELGVTLENVVNMKAQFRSVPSLSPSLCKSLEEMNGFWHRCFDRLRTTGC
jgi:enamine deaminase RidA (YjgF/YER057c/UK114 family)